MVATVDYSIPAAAALGVARAAVAAPAAAAVAAPPAAALSGSALAARVEYGLLREGHSDGDPRSTSAAADDRATLAAAHLDRDATQLCVAFLAAAPSANNAHNRAPGSVAGLLLSRETHSVLRGRRPHA